MCDLSRQTTVANRLRRLPTMAWQDKPICGWKYDVRGEKQIAEILRF